MLVPPSTRRAAIGDGVRTDLWRLVEQCQQGDIDAFGELYRATRDLIHGFLRRRVADFALADDLTHDVYVKALAAIGDVTPTAGSPAAWLVTIAQRRLADHYRRTGRRRTQCYGDMTARAFPFDGDLVEAVDVDDEPDVAVRVVADDVAVALWRHVQKLSPPQYEVLRLRFLLELTVDEAAAAMGVGYDACKSLQHRAMVTLRKRLRGTGLDPAAVEKITAGRPPHRPPF